MLEETCNRLKQRFRGESGKTPEKLRITGAGTISGEKYVYECDKENGYATRPADEAGGYEGRCLKMMEFYSPGDMNQERSRLRHTH